MIEYLKLALEPVLGNAEDLSCKGNDLLRFHPIDHRGRLSRVSDDDDWVDSLEGICLGWSEEYHTQTILKRQSRVGRRAYEVHDPFECEFKGQRAWIFCFSSMNVRNTR